MASSVGWEGWVGDRVAPCDTACFGTSTPNNAPYRLRMILLSAVLGGDYHSDSVIPRGLIEPPELSRHSSSGIPLTSIPRCKSHDLAPRIAFERALQYAGDHTQAIIFQAPVLSIR